MDSFTTHKAHNGCIVPGPLNNALPSTFVYFGPLFSRLVSACQREATVSSDPVLLCSKQNLIKYSFTEELIVSEVAAVSPLKRRHFCEVSRSLALMISAVFENQIQTRNGFITFTAQDDPSLI